MENKGPNKKKTPDEETLAEDRLSLLPDELLTRIMSRLSTKESFATSILSTRWKYLFTSVPSLSFDHYWDRRNKILQDHDPDKPAAMIKFTKFINQVLSAHNVSCISFKINMPYQCSFEDVSSWLSGAISRNPQILDLYITKAPPCPVPHTLFTSRTLTILRLFGNFIITGIKSVCLPAVKTLCIAECTIKDRSSAKSLLSNFPILERLTVSRCRIEDTEFVSLCAPMLKFLIINSTWNENWCEWELEVPNLETIECEGPKTKWHSVGTMKSLYDAEICLQGNNGENDDRVWGLVNKFNEVEYLSLLDDTMQSLASGSISLPMFNKLTTLVLRANLRQGWSIFPSLLERSPCLECLRLHENGFSDDNLEFPEINIVLPERVPVCFSLTLKEVVFRMLEEHKVEIEWLKYLLKNAKVLEKLIVRIPPQFTMEGREEYADESGYLERQTEIRKRLLALPRASKTCQIIIIGE